MRRLAALLSAVWVLASPVYAQQDNKQQKAEERCEFRLKDLICAVRQEVEPVIDAINPEGIAEGVGKTVKDVGDSIQKNFPPNEARRGDDRAPTARCADAKRVEDNCRPAGKQRGQP